MEIKTAVKTENWTNRDTKNDILKRFVAIQDELFIDDSRGVDASSLSSPQVYSSKQFTDNQALSVAFYLPVHYRAVLPQDTASHQYN